jgi:hypothetical protein
MSTLLQSQRNRLLQQLCLRYACPGLNASAASATSSTCSLVLDQLPQQQLLVQHALHPGAWTSSSIGAVRWYADAPEPMIVPLKRQQTAPQQSAAAAAAVAERNKGPWELVQDKASGGSYWWNQSTGEC